MKVFLLIGIVALFYSVTATAQKDYSYLDNEMGTPMEPILARAEPLVKEMYFSN